jgi:hypothetical protein
MNNWFGVNMALGARAQVPDVTQTYPCVNQPDAGVSARWVLTVGGFSAPFSRIFL